MQTKFSFNLIKGRLAETVIKELFLLNDYNVFNYGMEQSLPGITMQLRNNKSEFAKKIRFMPDYVVQDRANGDLNYVEVKFRANGWFGIDDLDKAYPYTNAWFIVVSPGKIQVIHYNMLKKGKALSPTTNYSLKKVKAFRLEHRLVDEFEKYTEQLFKGF